MTDIHRWHRRDVLGWAAAAAAGNLIARSAWGARHPAVAGIMSGDPALNRALVWAQTDRPARMWVEWSLKTNFADRRIVRGGDALAHTGFSAKTHLLELPSDRPIYYRVQFEDLSDLRTKSPYMDGRLRTIDTQARNLRIGWGGDVAGQGFGIDPSHGGYATFRTMQKFAFDYFIHSGDHIYADGPLQAEFKLQDGSIWKNVLSPAKSKVAETLEEFRGQYAYNLLDPSFRSFFAQTPVIAQWDDHETVNNWYPGEHLEDSRYKERSVNLLAARARLAFEQSLPIHPPLPGAGFERYIPCGPLADIFVLDARTYRGPNTTNRAHSGPQMRFFGPQQIDHLHAALRASRSTWKIIACDMPLGLVIPDGPHQEGMANDHPTTSGRENELVELLRALRECRIHNVVFVTADVHYAAAHYYEPSDFIPFWEFVAGPLHAGTFGPNKLDPSFRPRVIFNSRAPGAPANLPPSAGEQYFGVLDFDAQTHNLKVRLVNREGSSVYTKTLEPSRI